MLVSMRKITLEQFLLVTTLLKVDIQTTEVFTLVTMLVDMATIMRKMLPWVTILLVVSQASEELTVG